MFVKAVLRGGHVGCGKYYEMTRYLAVDNVVNVLSIAMKMPRVKKNSLALISCEQIDRDAYLEGKILEAKDPYLNIRKNTSQKGARCFA